MLPGERHYLLVLVVVTEQGDAIVPIDDEVVAFFDLVTRLVFGIELMVGIDTHQLNRTTAYRLVPVTHNGLDTLYLTYTY